MSEQTKEEQLKRLYESVRLAAEDSLVAYRHGMRSTDDLYEVAKRMARVAKDVIWNSAQQHACHTSRSNSLRWGAAAETYEIAAQRLISHYEENILSGAYESSSSCGMEREVGRVSLRALGCLLVSVRKIVNDTGK